MSRARDFQDTLTQTSFAKLHIWTWVKHMNLDSVFSCVSFHPTKRIHFEGNIMSSVYTFQSLCIRQIAEFYLLTKSLYQV